jgi:proteasome beta subunit
MTLIVALPTNDGVILASDGQLTRGLVRSSASKIYQLNDSCVWAASGELALIQRVQESLGTSFNPHVTLQDCRPHIVNAIKESMTALLQEDFRTQFFSNQPDMLLQLHQGDFVFVEQVKASPARVLHITTTGTSEWVYDAFASGSGDLFAYTLLRKYDLAKVNLDLAKVLAVKVIQEAIDVGSYGLGPPIAVYQITAQGFDQIGDTELAGLSDSARLIRENECAIFYDSKTEIT